MPMTFSSVTEQSNLSYRTKATNIFKNWKDSGFAGLTDQTFLACIQTMSAVPELAQYLHDKFGFHYILTGKFTSDPIEARFGWYHQVNGGNFFMFLKQLLEAEKKFEGLVCCNNMVCLLHLNCILMMIFHLPRWIKTQIQRVLKLLG